MKTQLLTIWFVIISGCAQRRIADFSPTRLHVTVVTYNVNWGFVQPQKVVDFLTAADADIVYFQETHSRKTF